MIWGYSNTIFVNTHIKNIQHIPNAGWIGGFLLAMLPSWQPASSQADVGEPNLRPGAGPCYTRFGVVLGFGELQQKPHLK